MPLKVNLAHHARPRIRRAMSCGGGVAAAAQEFHEQEWLVDGAHAHAFGNERAQAFVGGGGGRGH
jgi:hypothetical protein